MSVLQRLPGGLPDLRGRLQENAPLAPLTWFRVGGAAEMLFLPADEADLALFLKHLPDDVPVTVIGVGSNLLVREGGVDGVVIRLGAKGFGWIDVSDPPRVRCGTAVLDKKLAEAARDTGIGGLEFYYGIPGAVGGALRMNAGANGAETTNRLVSVRAVTRTGDRVTLSHAEMGYAYRHSAASPDLIFTAAEFEGIDAPRADIEAAMAAVRDHRETAQPIREKTGGSTFKNPPGQSAWKLVDAAGCRGLKIGGAQVSEQHCNFLINTGDATAYDLERLGETVRARVLETTGVRLDWEIKRIGRFVEGRTVTPFLQS